MKRDLIPQSGWKCPRDGARHVHLHAYVNGTDVWEEIVYACGHVTQQLAAHLLPESHFDAIECRFDRKLARSA